MAEAPKQMTPASLNDYLEVMSKAVFQSGISWAVVEAKWPGLREAFQGFDARTVAGFDVPEVDALAADPRVIRNRRKIEGIVHNARRMLELDHEYGAFRNYLRAHGDFAATLAALRRDFKYLGPTGVYYFLYVVGEDVPPHEEFKATYRKPSRDN
jgi:3-methyladenine DNA glycosylase Tag